MLTFLRKIRKSLVESGSTRKYLIYALGEILLVMIGILLALQVNNWNENRKARDTENQSLISLKEEFQKNHADLQEHILWKQEVKSEWNTFLRTVSNMTLPVNKRAVRRPVASFANYNISNSTLQSLLATGKIENLNNDSLKYFLSTWPDVVNEYQQFQDMHSDFVIDELMHFELNLFPDDSNSRYGYDNLFQSSGLRKEMLVKAYEDMNYQNILLRNFYWINIQLEKIEELEEKMDQIIHLLENEIGQKDSKK